LQSATDEFEYSEDFAEDALPDRIDFEQIPVDPENPGFASLLPALVGVAHGQYDPIILEAYLAGLSPRLEEARAQLHSLDVPEAVREQVAPALAATQAVLDEMGFVLDLLEHYLSQGAVESLSEAVERLSRIHSELQHAL